MAKDWIPSWMRKDEDKEEKNELPKELKDEIANSVKASTDPINEKLKSLDSLVAFAADYQKDKKEAKDKEEEAERIRIANKNKKEEESDEDLAARLLSDPKSVLNEANRPVINLALSIKADNVKREVFEDRKEEFPYYEGDVRKEIDGILSKQTLAFRNDPLSVENVYYTVVGKKQKEISEGKIKSRFASVSSSTNSSKTDENFSIEITPEITRAARLSGMDIGDYTKLLEKAAKAGEIEYV